MSLHCIVTDCADPNTETTRLAEYGVLCGYHWTWLNRDLADCAELVENIRHETVPSSSPKADGMPRAGKADPPAPINLDAVDVADEIYTTLRIACDATAHPIQQPPPVETVWAAQGYTQGLPAYTQPEDAGRKTRSLVSWLRRHLREISELPDIADLAEQLRAVIPTAKARWPITDRERHFPGGKCRNCARLNLWMRPPEQFEEPALVSCRSCGYIAHDFEKRTA
ncbi:hypothetical protein LWF01_02880 [Saxibacter everestensis]|uniref:Uncharacterized protein n=1 Tax=Saxibacter everestensis TaxID=2909229 RepID=A0ABY8QUS3_9MICO|nr:hypothetical protein LWF01_02880 [Brevibacteriaceae bacterium ZFBP1038]